MPNFPITGVVRPLSGSSAINNQVPLTSGWILLIVGVIILIFIIFFRKKFERSKSEKYETEEQTNLLNPLMINSFQKKYLDIKNKLIKKGLSEEKAEKCIEYIISSA
jgi:beta-lactamase regulating signal transducer with metallopeptidase domain